MKITEVWRSVRQECSSKSGPIGGYLLRVLGSRKRDLTGTRTHVVLANILLQPWIESC
jgi:hypothetical protein